MLLVPQDRLCIFSGLLPGLSTELALHDTGPLVYTGLVHRAYVQNFVQGLDTELMYRTLYRAFVQGVYTELMYRTLYRALHRAYVQNFVHRAYVQNFVQGLCTGLVHFVQGLPCVQGLARVQGGGWG